MGQKETRKEEERGRQREGEGGMEEERETEREEGRRQMQCRQPTGGKKHSWEP